MPSISQLLQNRAVQIALGIVAVIAAGSVAYYLIEATPPSVAYATATTGNITADVAATGIVTPVQNPTLSFEQGGQVETVSAKAGQKVAAGTLLATLDTSVLSASLDAAEAQLNSLEAPARSVDVAGQQTTVETAQTTLANAYANYPQALTNAYAKSQEAVTTQADPLFIIYNPADPALNFNISITAADPSLKSTVDGERAQLSILFPQWQKEVSSVTSTSSPAQLQEVTQETLTNLMTVQTFLNDLISAINSAQVGGSFTQAQQTTGFTSVSAARDTINGLITSLNAANQSLGTEQLAVQSAQDQLNQTNAGASSQSIQAQQAVVAGIEAQIHQQEIVAPFGGTIAAVSVKPGDIVTANTQAISLIPNGTFEVDVYLAENDVAQVKTGDMVDVTLDAYGTGRNFPATVGSVDTSPSIDPNSAGGTDGGYKVTLIFASADPAIANGMHANATIHTGSAMNVLEVPKSAIITQGTQSFVLKQTPSGPVQTPVTTGLESSTSVQILSGLSAGDSVSAVGAQ
jgi:RND family efflux transporter MFP subunit